MHRFDMPLCWAAAAPAAAVAAAASDLDNTNEI